MDNPNTANVLNNTDKQHPHFMLFPWQVFLVVGIIAYIVLGIFGYSIVLGYNMANIYERQIDAVMKIKYETTLSHLWIEEIISGDRNEDITQVWRHMDQAAWYASALLVGGHNSEGRIKKIKDSVLYPEFEKVMEELKRFRVVAEARYSATAAAGTNTDQKFDSVFAQLLAQSDHLEKEIRASVSNTMRLNNRIQIVLVTVILGLAIAIGLVFNRYERSKASIFQLLEEKEDRLRSMIQNIRTGVVIHSANTSIIDSNASAQDLLGLTKDQMLGKKAINPRWKFFREDGSDMPVDEYPVNQVIAMRDVLKNCIMGINRPETADVVWVIINAIPEFNRIGELTRIIVTFVDITDYKIVQENNKQLVVELQDALDNIKTLSGLLPICASCKNIRDEAGNWTQMEVYISKRSEADFTHGWKD